MTSPLRTITAVLLCAGVFASCGSETRKPSIQSRDGKFALVDTPTEDGSLTASQAASSAALEMLNDLKGQDPDDSESVNVLIVQGDEATRGAVAARKAGNYGSPDELLIFALGPGSDPVPEFVRRGDVTGFVKAPNHGKATIDLAVLAALGVKPPKRHLRLGTTMLSSESVTFGGEKFTGPDSEQLTAFFAEHQRLLTTPDDQRVLRIGISLSRVTQEERARILATIEKRANSYRRSVRLEVKDTKLRPRIQTAQIAELIDAEVDALILYPSLPDAIPKLLKNIKGIPTILVNEPVEGSSYSCCISTPPELLGRALGKLILRTAWKGGRIVAMRSSSEPHSEVYHESLMKRLGFQPPTDK